MYASMPFNPLKRKAVSIVTVERAVNDHAEQATDRARKRPCAEAIFHPFLGASQHASLC
jgi:hypothetical protein